MSRQVSILREFAIPMSDGTATRAEVWLPADGETHPALVAPTLRAGGELELTRVESHDLLASHALAA